MLRLLLLILLSCALGAAAPAPAPDTAPLTPAQARAALEVLNNPHKRAELAVTLEAIAKAQPAATPTAEGAKPAPAAAAAKGDTKAQPAGANPIELAPNGLGAEVLLGAERLMNQASEATAKALHAMNSLPALWGWAVVMATNPWARGILISVAWRLAVALVCALAVQFAFARAVSRPVALLEGTAAPRRQAASDADSITTAPEPLPAEPPPAEEAIPPAFPVTREDGEARAEAGETEPPPPRQVSAWGYLRRVPLAVGRLLLDAVPVLGFLVAGHLIAASPIADKDDSRVVILAVIDAYVFCALVLCIARMMLSPAVPRLRLFHLSDRSSAYLMRWTRRLIVVAVFGYAIAEVGFLLGLTQEAHRGLMKADGFVLRIMLITMVLQKRGAVRKWLRAPAGATGAWARLRNAFAYVWHWIALFFIVGSWLVWAIDVQNGFSRLLHFWLVAGLLLVGTRLLLIVLDGSLDRALRVPQETAARYPGLEARLRLYHPGLSLLVRALVYVLLLLALLQVYGVSSFSWLVASNLGHHALSAFGTVLVTVMLALFAWEAANIGMQRHLEKLEKEMQKARSARLRTLLPLLRSALMITILVFAGLTVLSEIGINIAPLLAGAGIVGVAIGFGSQKLVQDLITGIFLLLENAMQVGDVVNVAGQGGVVESLSVRTIRLRSEDGSVHVIPFSSVTTVTNMTKDYSRAVIAAGIAYKEDYDQVVDVLKGIAKEMRAETAWQPIILDDLEVWGLDQLGDSAVVIKCRIMCTPFGRWSVLREFNRRMKKRFDELGIEIPFPHRKLVIEGALPVQAAPAEAPPAAEVRAAEARAAEARAAEARAAESGAVATRTGETRATDTRPAEPAVPALARQPELRPA